MSKNFGWTPEQIDRLTHDQLEIYIDQINKKEKSNLPSVEITMREIRNVIFGMLGIKEKEENTDKQLKEKLLRVKEKTRTVKSNMNVMDDMSGDLIEEWIQQGTPDLIKFRKKHKNRLINNGG
jgi:hypothetical protein